ncbi:unnamed protein product [Caenorhabditis brenneri]
MCLHPENYVPNLLEICRNDRLGCSIRCSDTTGKQAVWESNFDRTMMIGPKDIKSLPVPTNPLTIGKIRNFHLMPMADIQRCLEK